MWEKVFDQIWTLCGENGWCDAIGGMEYRRVRQEWQESGYPLDIVGFIRRRANILSVDGSREN